MFVNFKNFNGNVNTVLGDSINVSIKNKISLKMNMFCFERNEAPFLEIPMYDGLSLKAEAKKLFRKCLQIGIKDTYSEGEQRFINNFFGFSAAVNFLVPRVYETLKASTGFTNLTDEESPKNVLVYDSYAVGFESVRKLCCLTTETGLEDKSLSLSVSPLNTEEIKKFISYLNKYTYDTFNISVWGVKK